MAPLRAAYGLQDSPAVSAMPDFEAQLARVHFLEFRGGRFEMLLLCFEDFPHRLAGGFVANHLEIAFILALLRGLAACLV